MIKLKIFCINKQSIIRQINYKGHAFVNNIGFFKYYVNKSKKFAQNFGLKDSMEIDAFRHAWTSANITFKHGTILAKILGDCNDYLNIFTKLPHANMDLWNNKKGRELGRLAKKNKIQIHEIPELIKKAFDSNLLIKDPEKDTRKYGGFAFYIFKKLNKFFYCQ